MRLYLVEDENIEDYDIDRKTIDYYFKKYNIQFCDFNVEIKDIGSAEARATDMGLIILNSKKPRTKISQIEQRMNNYLLYVLSFKNQTS